MIRGKMMSFFISAGLPPTDLQVYFIILCRKSKEKNEKNIFLLFFNIFKQKMLK